MLLGYQITDLQIKMAILLRTLILYLFSKRVYPGIFLSSDSRFVRGFHRQGLSYFFVISAFVVLASHCSSWLLLDISLTICGIR